jgi:hypothetical protein
MPVNHNGHSVSHLMSARTYMAVIRFTSTISRAHELSNPRMVQALQGICLSHLIRLLEQRKHAFGAR